MGKSLASEQVHNHLIDKVAILNSLAGAVALYPQLYILFRYQTGTENFSSVSFALILSNSLIWLWYGYHRKLLPLVISSLCNAIAAGAILILIR